MRQGFLDTLDIRSSRTPLNSLTSMYVIYLIDSLWLVGCLGNVNNAPATSGDRNQTIRPPTA